MATTNSPATIRPFEALRSSAGNCPSTHQYNYSFNVTTNTTPAPTTSTIGYLCSNSQNVTSMSSIFKSERITTFCQNNLNIHNNNCTGGITNLTLLNPSTTSPAPRS
jgi:hypothetical protein